MNIRGNIIWSIAFLMIASACQTKQEKAHAEEYQKGSFGYDATFLAKYQQTIILENGDAMLAVSPAYQGRVMTSTSGGYDGLSYGWLNYKLIESGENLPHINPVGGEDRFWLGPEGGQFSIYFKPGDEFIFDNWQTPAPIDSEPFNIISVDDQSVAFTRDFSVSNYSGNTFYLKVTREVSFITKDELNKHFPIDENLNYVAYQSKNTIMNVGEHAWTKETGALSIWILGMLNPSPKTTIIVPFVQGSDEELGPIVNDTYFGKVPAERLKIQEGVMFLNGDGKYRSKIGLNPRRSKPYMGSYDAEKGILTIVYYSKPKDIEDYVNSIWEIQDAPFAGDVVNSYNDGPVDGSALGPFYELETSSPAAFLAPEESLTHVHATVHIRGEEAGLNTIMMKLFNTNISTVKNIFP